MKIADRDEVRVVRPGKGLVWAKEFVEESLVGADFEVCEDLSRFATLDATTGPGWDAFKETVASYQRPLGPGVEESRSVGVKAGNLLRLVAVLQDENPVLSPIQRGAFLVGRIQGSYFWRPDLPPNRPRHCRRARWLGQITNAQLSPATRKALTSWNAVFSISPGELGHADLIEVLRQLPNGRAPAGLAPASHHAADGQPDELERIVAWDGERHRQVAFHGRWLTEWIDPTGDVHFYRVAQTRRGAIAVLDADEGATMTETGEHAARVLRVYDDLEAADKGGVPYAVILAAAEALGIDYSDAIDI